MGKSFIVNYYYLTGAILTLLVAFLTATGNIQSYIRFADVTNEIAFCFFACMLSAVLAISSFSKSK